MKYIQYWRVIIGWGMLLACSFAWASDADNEVTIDIVADKMSAQAVEADIADPIEVVFAKLKDVLLISAKYSDNRAEITVRFDPDTTEPQGRVWQVRQALDELTELPESIVSLSVSLSNDASVQEIAASTSSIIRPAPPRTFTGHYLGTIQSSNELIPILTHFAGNITTGGSLFSGHYQMTETKAVVTGQLTSCLPKDGVIVTCRWKDKYGQGDVNFQFTDDYERFKALWVIDRIQGEFKWSGAKVKSTTP